jgi:outer membrane protein OmpA-like peptidoglycan-associated protein
MKKLFFGLLFVGFAISLQAQKWKRQQADQFYEEYNYVKALPLYESLIDKDAEVYRRMAEIYHINFQYDKAAKAYGELIKNGGYDADDIYKYAYYLMMSGNVSESIKWMNKYADLRPKDTRAKRFLEDPEFYKKLLQEVTNVGVYLTGINSERSDFGPAYYIDSTVVFTSARGFGRKWGGNMQRFLDLYIAKMTPDNNLTNVKKFFGTDVNKKYHDGPAAFNRKGDLMIVTRNIYTQKTEENKLWLYELVKDSTGKWSKPKPLPFNSVAYSCGHATLNDEGNVMFFASDMPGGLGESDIYVTYRDENGNWSVPKNLGDVVNSEGDEKFPFYDPDGGYLFYASDGLPGLGGLDLFVLKVNEEIDMFSLPVNLGQPINSSYDDFALIYKYFFENGFFSSNRPGGVGSDDIYGFMNLKVKKKADFFTLSGVIRDEVDNKPLIGALVELYDPTGKLIAKQVTGEDGKFDFGKFVNPKYYKIKVTKPDYGSNEVQITKTDVKVWDINKELKLKTEVPYYCKIKITPLYYDLDKAFIRKGYFQKLDSIYNILTENPELRLSISSHTDSRASHAYNEKLSKRRALAVVEYLTGKGIDRDRLVVSWHGETQPVNHCVDGVKCSEKLHQMNRRTEFKIIGCDKYLKEEEEEMEQNK